MASDEVPYKKVPVARNEVPERCCYLELSVEFDAKDQDMAREVATRLVELVEGYAEVTGQKLSMNSSDADGAAEAIFEEETNDADTALRKLTKNKGNQLWIEYLQMQLSAAKGFRV